MSQRFPNYKKLVINQNIALFMFQIQRMKNLQTKIKYNIHVYRLHFLKRKLEFPIKKKKMNALIKATKIIINRLIHDSFTLKNYE